MRVNTVYQEPCVNKLKRLFLIEWHLISVYLNTVGLFQLITSLLSLEKYFEAPYMVKTLCLSYPTLSV
jgi:hypothetical protein